MEILLDHTGFMVVLYTNYFILFPKINGYGLYYDIIISLVLISLGVHWLPMEAPIEGDICSANDSAKFAS